jgi:hypothetical protein
MKISPWRSTLFSRILLIVGGLLAVLSVYWLVQVSLAPVSVPPAPGARGVIRFDPKLDVSKNELFFRLRSLGPQDVSIPSLGRANPFLPIVQVQLPPVGVSSSTATTGTSAP